MKLISFTSRTNVSLGGILLLGILLLASCKDKCEDEPALDFEIGEEFTFTSWGIDQVRLLTSDTFWQDARITFRAVDGFYNYRWKVGTDPEEFTDQSFHLDFREVYPRIEVRLIADRLGSDCPDLPASDTVFHSFAIVPRQSDERWVGTYRGVVDTAVQDTFQFQILQGPNGEPPYFYDLYVSDFPNGCSWDDNDLLDFFFYDYFIIRGGNFGNGQGNVCQVPTAWGYMDDSGNVEVECAYRDLSDTHYFYGKKID